MVSIQIEGDIVQIVKITEVVISNGISFPISELTEQKLNQIQKITQNPIQIKNK